VSVGIRPHLKENAGSEKDRPYHHERNAVERELRNVGQVCELRHERTSAYEDAERQGDDSRTIGHDNRTKPLQKNPLISIGATFRTYFP
jgi:hypothetical protein